MTDSAAQSVPTLIIVGVALMLLTPRRAQLAAVGEGP